MAPRNHYSRAIGLVRFIRKKLGRVKCVIIDQWPYRRFMNAIPHLRDQYRPFLNLLPESPRFRKNVYEIHMLCGHRDADMGIFASWSILRFLDGLGKLYVHSDGTLSESDIQLWQKVVSGMTVVSRAESDAKTEEELGASTKHLYQWRCSNWASAQLVDVHYYGDTSNILIMDSDVLAFATPHEVLDALTSSVPRFAWCRDLRDAYSSSLEVLEQVTGIQVPRRLCAGFLVTPRLRTADFIDLDQHLQRIDADPRIALDHFWSCQTYYAIIAGRHLNARSFPRQYSNITGRTGGDQILRHYVGIPKVRFRYFTEGIPRILKQVGLHEADRARSLTGDTSN